MEHFLGYSGSQFIMVDQNDLCYGVNLFIADQSLKINFLYSSRKCIVINFLDQHIIFLAFHIQHHLAALAGCCKNTIHFQLVHFNGNGAFDLPSEYVSGNVTFSSKSLGFHIHASFFSF